MNPLQEKKGMAPPGWGQRPDAVPVEADVAICSFPQTKKKLGATREDPGAYGRKVAFQSAHRIQMAELFSTCKGFGDTKDVSSKKKKGGGGGKTGRGALCESRLQLHPPWRKKPV